MSFRPAAFAVVGVGADEHAAAAIVEHHFVQVDVLRTAEAAGLGEALHGEGIILEVQAAHARVRRHGVDALLAAGAEQLQRLAVVHLRVVELRRGRRVHDVAAGDLDRIGIGGGDVAVARDVLVELDVHEAVVGERMELARLCLTRLEEAERLGDRHLVDDDLAGRELRFGDAVAGLDDGRRGSRGGGGDAGGAGEELADGDGVGGVVRALVDYLQHVVRAEDGRRHLHAAGAPAIGHRHLAAGERNLVTGNGDRLQNRATDHPLGLLVEVGEVVAGDGVGAHSAASATAPAAWAARIARTSTNSAWKST